MLKAMVISFMLLVPGLAHSQFNIFCVGKKTVSTHFDKKANVVGESTKPKSFHIMLKVYRDKAFLIGNIGEAELILLRPLEKHLITPVMVFIEKTGSGNLVLWKLFFAKPPFDYVIVTQQKSYTVFDNPPDTYTTVYICKKVKNTPKTKL